MALPADFDFMVFHCVHAQKAYIILYSSVLKKLKASLQGTPLKWTNSVQKEFQK